MQKTEIWPVGTNILYKMIEKMIFKGNLLLPHILFVFYLTIKFS